MNNLNLSIQKISIIIGCILAIVSLFLPWFSVSYLISDFTQSGYESNGWIALVLLSVILIITIIGDRSEPLPIGLMYIAIALLLITSGFGLYKYFYPGNFNSSDFFTGVMESFNNTAINSVGSKEYGLYLFISFCIITPIIAFVMKDK